MTSWWTSFKVMLIIYFSLLFIEPVQVLVVFICKSHKHFILQHWCLISFENTVKHQKMPLWFNAFTRNFIYLAIYFYGRFTASKKYFVAVLSLRCLLIFYQSSQKVMKNLFFLWWQGFKKTNPVNLHCIFWKFELKKSSWINLFF